MNIEPQEPGFSHTLTFVPKSLEAIASSLIRSVYAVWNEKRGARRFPPKAAISPRDIKDGLKFTSLMEVVDGGRDFSYRLRGDGLMQAIRRAYGAELLGKTASEFGDLGELYDLAHRRVVESGVPRVVETCLQLGSHMVRDSEILYLPLGEDDRRVDHIMAVCVPLPRCEPECGAGLVPSAAP